MNLRHSTREIVHMRNPNFCHHLLSSFAAKDQHLEGRCEAANFYNKLIYDSQRCALSPSDRSSPIPHIE